MMWFTRNVSVSQTGATCCGCKLGEWLRVRAREGGGKHLFFAVLELVLEHRVAQGRNGEAKVRTPSGRSGCSTRVVIST